MSNYKTYILNKGDFALADDLQNIAITTAVGSEEKGWTEYVIKAKCGLETPIGRIIEMMQAGMNFTMTLESGEKYKLELTKVEQPPRCPRCGEPLSAEATVSFAGELFGCNPDGTQHFCEAKNAL